MSSLYETGEYLKTNPDWHDEDGAWKAHQIAKMLRANPLDIKTVADVGCGSGRVLQTLSDELPAETVMCGYDIADAAVQLAKAHETETLSFQCADFLTQEDKVFDLVLLMDVFEHVPDYLGFLEKLRSRSKYHIFHVPLDMNAMHVILDHQKNSRDYAGHLHYFSKTTALMTLEDAGYDVIDWFYTPVFKTAKARRSALKLMLELPRTLGQMLFPDFAVRLLGGCSVLVLAQPKENAIK